MHGPWEVDWIDPPESPHDPSQPLLETLPEPFLRPGLVRMPASWQTLFGGRKGVVRFLRRFQWPTNLEPQETAWIVFDGVGGKAHVRLNDEPLGPASTGTTFEITRRLRSTNTLVVEISFQPSGAPDEPPGGLFNTVALEIRDEAASHTEEAVPRLSEPTDASL